MQTNNSSNSLDHNRVEAFYTKKASVKNEQEKKFGHGRENPSSNDQSSKKSKTSFIKLFTNIGYSVWIIVMVIGGIMAFIISLFLI